MTYDLRFGRIQSIKLLPELEEVAIRYCFRNLINYLKAKYEEINIVMINLQELKFDYLLEYHELHKYILEQHNEDMTMVKYRH